MDPKRRRTIAWEYYGELAFIAAFLTFGIWTATYGDSSDAEITRSLLPVYFCAAFLLIHAQGRRIRQTLLALHGEKP